MQYAGNTALAAALAPGQVRDVSIQVQFDWNNDGLFTHPYSDLSALTTSVQLQENLQGDVPQELLLLEGYMTAQLDVVLAGSIPMVSPSGAQLAAFGGASIEATQLFGAYSTPAPLYGLLLEGSRCRYSVVVATSGGPVTIQMFFGQVTSVEVDRANDQVKIEALDLSSFLQAGVTFPVFSSDGGAMGALVAAGQDPLLLNSAWCIDYVCRANSFYNGPPAVSANAGLSTQTTCGVHFTMAGGMLANIGTTVWNSCEFDTAPSGGTYFDQKQLWPPGKYGLCADGTLGPTMRGAADSVLALQVDTAFSILPVIGIGMWVYYPTAPAGTTTVMTIDLDTTVNPVSVITLTAQNNGAGATLFKLNVTGNSGYNQTSTSTFPTVNTGAWHYIGAAIQFGSGLGVTVRWNVDGTESSSLDTLSTGTYPNVGAKLVQGFTVVHVNGCRMQHVQVWYNQAVGNGLGAQPWPTNPNTNYPVSDIAVGNNQLYYLPDVNQDNSWNVLKELTDAELGVLWTTEFGVVTFRSRTQIQAGYQSGTSVATLTTDNLVDAAYVSNWDGIRNVINYSTQSGANGGGFQNSVGAGVAWQSTNPFQLPARPGQTTTWTIPTSQTFVEVRGVILDTTNAGTWTTTSPPVLTAVTDTFTACDSSTGLPVTTGVSVKALPVAGGRSFVLQVTNTSGHTVLLGYISTSSGSAGNTACQPCCIVPGWPLVLNNPVTNQLFNQQSENTYGTRSYDMVTNAFCQHSGAIGFVAQSLLSDLRAPVPQLQNMPIVGDPRLQLGDPVTIQDSAYIGTTIVGGISGRVHSYDTTSGLRDQLTVRLRFLPGSWVLGTPDKSILGGTRPTTILVK